MPAGFQAACAAGQQQTIEQWALPEVPFFRVHVS